MVRTVYIDLLFLINFTMDYLCFFVTARILAGKMRMFRTAFASAIGGLYAVFSIFLPVHGFPLLLLDSTACVLICMIAYYEKGRPLSAILRETLFYTGVSLFLGGVMTAIYAFFGKSGFLALFGEEEDGVSSLLFFLLAAVGGGISSLGSRFFARRAGERVYRLSILLCGKRLEIFGTVDTGNRLSDPISGLPVVAVEEGQFSLLLPPTLKEQIAGPPEQLYRALPEEYRRRARLIPAETATGRGLLIGFLPEEIKIDGKSEKILLAPVPLHLSGSDALLPAGRIYP